MRRDTRNFITVTASMPESEKVEGLSDAAFRALVETWCWCFRQQNDGRMTRSAWERRTTPKVRRELETPIAPDRAPLVEDCGDGWVQMHDYTDHQQSRADKERLSAARSEAGKRGGEAKARAKQQAAKDVASASDLLSNSVAEQNRREQIPNSGGVVDLPLGGRDDENRRLAQELVTHHRAALRARRAPDLRGSLLAAYVDRVAGCLAEGIDPDVIRQALPMLDDKRLGPGALASVAREVQLGPRRPPSGTGRFDTDRAMADALAMEQEARQA